MHVLVVQLQQYRQSCVSRETRVPILLQGICTNCHCIKYMLINYFHLVKFWHSICQTLSKGHAFFSSTIMKKLATNIYISFFFHVEYQKCHFAPKLCMYVETVYSLRSIKSVAHFVLSQYKLYTKWATLFMDRREYIFVDIFQSF